MAKLTMTCPFSSKLCVECAIYRGRHYYLCFKTGYRGCLWDSREISEQTEKTCVSDDEKFGIPGDVPASSRWITDVEELVEERELGKFKERREA